MIKIKNILTYAICMFFMFILSINSVYAMTFYQDGELHYNDSFELCSGCNHMTFIKHAENGDYAYCGAQNLSFRGPSGRPNSNYVYKKDKSWSNAGGCSYYVAKKDENGKFVKDKNGKVKYQKKRGDCSVILGYIIKKVHIVIIMVLLMIIGNLILRLGVFYIKLGKLILIIRMKQIDIEKLMKVI